MTNWFLNGLGRIAKAIEWTRRKPIDRQLLELEESVNKVRFRRDLLAARKEYATLSLELLTMNLEETNKMLAQLEDLLDVVRVRVAWYKANVEKRDESPPVS